MKINEIQIGQDYKEIEGILNFANQQTQTITTQQGKQLTKQSIAIDGVQGDFWCGERPLKIEECNKPIKLLCKASVYQGNTQYNFRRPSQGGGRRGYGGKSQQEIDETRRSIAFSYLVDKQKLGMEWGHKLFLYANILETWMKDGKMPVTFAQGTGGGYNNVPAPDPSIQEDSPPPSDEDIPY